MQILQIHLFFFFKSSFNIMYMTQPKKQRQMFKNKCIFPFPYILTPSALLAVESDHLSF